MHSSNIIPPIYYSDDYTYMAIAAVVIVLLYVVLALVFTRKKKPKVVKMTSVEELEAARERARKKSIQSIDDAVTLHTNGSLSTRELNQKLGVILRDFAAEYSGMKTRSMTLDDLKRNKVPVDLVTAVEEFYPYAFRNMVEGKDPSAAIKSAREVIYKWY